MLDNTAGGGKTNNARQYRGRGKDKQCWTIQEEGERQTMLDNTEGGGKTNNVRQYRGMGKTNNVRQYRRRGKDKQC